MATITARTWTIEDDPDITIKYDTDDDSLLISDAYNGDEAYIEVLTSSIDELISVLRTVRNLAP